ncbi:Hypermethylated in cancer 2 protein [Balamuthia mandrillaris]
MHQPPAAAEQQQPPQHEEERGSGGEGAHSLGRPVVGGGGDMGWLGWCGCGALFGASVGAVAAARNSAAPPPQPPLFFAPKTKQLGRAPMLAIYGAGGAALLGGYYGLRKFLRVKSQEDSSAVSAVAGFSTGSLWALLKGEAQRGPQRVAVYGVAAMSLALGIDLAEKQVLRAYHWQRTRYIQRLLQEEEEEMEEEEVEQEEQHQPPSVASKKRNNGFFSGLLHPEMERDGQPQHYSAESKRKHLEALLMNERLDERYRQELLLKRELVNALDTSSNASSIPPSSSTPT